MDLLEQINDCASLEYVDALISEAIKDANKNSTAVEQLGFLDYDNWNYLFKGFIPFNARIKYEKNALETYSMKTTDYFYEFAHFIWKHNINNKNALVYNLQYFLYEYFGYPGQHTRENIFEDKAWQETTTDEEYFEALENNQLGDLKGTGAAQCTEMSALVQQILSLFGTETYYCIGCADLGGREEAHAFNVVKRKNDYALLDYSCPVASYNPDGSLRAYYPFIGSLTNEEFVDFVDRGVLKEFPSYEYTNKTEKKILDSSRQYIIGSDELPKEQTIGIKR